jgi:hypothetical protein
MPLHLLAQSVEYTRFGIFHILNLDQNFLLFFYYYYGTQTTVDAIICVLTMSNLFLFDTLTLCAKSWVHCFYSLPFKFNSCRSLGLWQSHRPVSLSWCSMETQNDILVFSYMLSYCTWMPNRVSAFVPPFTFDNNEKNL